MALNIYSVLIDLFEARNKNDTKKELEFLNSFTPELVTIITLDFYSKTNSEANDVFRQFFSFYASKEEYYIEGLKFFSRFPTFIKAQQFNSIKAFLFYFAYQSKKFGSDEVKILLSQKLINALILNNKSYLDFCMYTFYRGLYYIENKDFYMASYYYCSSVLMAIKSNINNMKILNGFNCQMIRSLCLLKYLTNFDISSALFKDSKFHRRFDDYLLIDHQDVAFCLEFIKDEKKDLKSFKEFVEQNKDNLNNCCLKGLYKAAEEEIIFRMIKDFLKIYKRTRTMKLCQVTQLDFNVVMKILKKKVLEGEISIKYDESQEVIEVLDIDPGLKEKVQKNKELYEKIMEGNKNMFMDLKNQKLDKLSGKGNELFEIEANVINNQMYEIDED